MMTKTKLIDQYNDEVPSDLVVLDFDVAELSGHDCRQIDRLSWYQPGRNKHQGWQGMILVSYAALVEALGESFGGFDGTDPADCGIDELAEVEYIDSCLHRWNESDGFYHA